MLANDDDDVDVGLVGLREWRRRVAASDSGRRWDLTSLRFPPLRVPPRVQPRGGERRRRIDAASIVQPRRRRRNRVLLEFKADVSTVDDNGKTPLETAGYEENVTMLHAHRFLRTATKASGGEHRDPGMLTQEFILAVIRP
jgi:hypothetical protein